MWSERDRRYGGLQWRHIEFKGGTVACTDPLRKCPVAFATELHYENWLLHWAESDIKNLIPHSGRLTCLDHGVCRSIIPDLQFRRDSIEIQLVIAHRNPASDARIYALQRIAEAHEFLWSVRTRQIIRAQPALLDNLHRLRQSAVMYADNWEKPLWRPIEYFIERNPATTRADVRERIGKHIPDAQIDAVLIRMHALGRIKLDLSEKIYGDDTKINQC